MKLLRGTPAVAAGLIAAAVQLSCSEPVTAPESFETVLFNQQHEQGEAHHFGSPLSGGEEVPSNASRARGNAIFWLSEDGAELHYRLIVANIENVLQAHIHCGPAGSNGPVVLWLYPSAPPASLIPGRSSGILNEATATQANVIARPASAACPGGVATLADVVAKMRTGGAYTNVHTQQFPPGEVRGQIRGHGNSP
jgi:hypothetical protein